MQRTSCAYLVQPGQRGKEREKHVRTKHGATNKSYFPSERLNIGRARDDAMEAMADVLFLIPSHLAQKAEGD